MKDKSVSPPFMLASGFLVLICIGSVLLKLPVSTLEPITWQQAVFTATSAVTVTGLSVVDIAQFSRFGQVIIALLIQTGGLGFMSFAVSLVLTFHGQMGLKSQMLAKEAFGLTSFRYIGETARNVVKFALIFELIGFILLTLFWWPEKGLHEAAYASFFYTISAYNNAGFALTADSLMADVSNVGVNLVITALIILGGLGFLVLSDIQRNKAWKRFSLNTKLMVSATIIINLTAFLIFWLLERHNPATLGLMNIDDQLLAAWFQAVSPRTAGFNTIPIHEMTDASTMLILLLMFIGGGSVSTASGLKVGTFVVLFLATIAFIRRKKEVVLFRRSLPEESVHKALALFSITLILIWLSVFILSVVEAKHEFIDVLFEVVSALGTVGLSRGITGLLSPAGEWVLMVMMFAGRIGPLTLAYLIALPHIQKIRYPQEHVQIG